MKWDLQNKVGIAMLSKTLCAIGFAPSDAVREVALANIAA